MPKGYEMMKNTEINHPIPEFNKQGRLPPNDIDAHPLIPYEVSCEDFVRCFATSKKRIDLMHVLFAELRQTLYKHHILSGYQWINGSFAEKKENPNDIDLVTWYKRNSEQDEEILAELSDPGMWIPKGVHHFLECEENNDSLRWKLYWHDAWSHVRPDPETGLQMRKGYLQIDLDPTSDAIVIRNLESMRERYREL